MMQRLASAGLGFDLRCGLEADPEADPESAPGAGLPSVTVSVGHRLGAPPGSEFGAAHLRPGRFGHQPDDDSDELVPPGAGWLTEPGWPVG